MRFSLVAGFFSILLAGSGLAASAAESSTAPASGGTAVAVAISEAQSPDIATWTSGSTVSSLSQAGTASAPVHSHNLSRFAARILSRTAGVANGLTRDALRFLGVPYVFGGTSGGGFDCSGYVQHVFAMVGLHIPRTADAQYFAGSKIHGSMIPGDLVFFQTYEPGPSHVGIYLGNGRFAHASSSHGVMVSSLSDSYWSARYIGAKRLASR